MEVFPLHFDHLLSHFSSSDLPELRKPFPPQASCRGTLTPIPRPCPFPPLHPCPRQPLIFLLSLWICLFWIFHVNGILRYVGFCFSVCIFFVDASLPVLGLRRCKRWLRSSWGARSSHGGDFSCRRTQASVVVAPGLICSTGRGIFPHRGSNLRPLH